MNNDIGKLGRLEKVDVRSVWPTEDGHFTRWLGEDENLRQLAQDLGLDFSTVSTEEAVGPFSADIFCVRTDDDSSVVIENQFGRTDHDHLGKLLTYAAGLEARTMIWVSERFTDEHRAAIDMLNNTTNEDFNYFGVEIEVLRIGDSEPAPRFNVVAQPNEWSKTAKQAAEVRRELSPARKLQFEFWMAFRQHMEEHSELKCGSVAPRYWQKLIFGLRGVNLASHFKKSRGTAGPGWWHLRAEVYFHGHHAMPRFGLLREDSEAIEREFGGELTWFAEEKKTRRIYVQKEIEPENRGDWPGHHRWLQENHEKLAGVFVPRIKTLNPDDWVVESAE